MLQDKYTEGLIDLSKKNSLHVFGRQISVLGAHLLQWSARTADLPPTKTLGNTNGTKGALKQLKCSIKKGWECIWLPKVTRLTSAAPKH